MSVTIKGISLAALSLLLIASCTNKRANESLWKTAYAAVKPKPEATAPDPQVVATAVKQAMVSTQGPLALMSLERTKAVAVLRPVEANGSYRTWATWGSSERRSITTKRGMLTATRGLGFDLMSSDVDGLLNLVSARREGKARLVQRYLDGENVIQAVVATCGVTRGGSQNLVAGELNQSVTQMNAACQSEGHRFSNSYLVSSSGRILQARQWHGPHFGEMAMQQLR